MEVISKLGKNNFSGMVEGRKDGNHGGSQTGVEWSMCLWGQRTQLGESVPSQREYRNAQGMNGAENI